MLVFTGGQTAGTATFQTPAAGSYVARAFPKNTYEILAEAGFTVVNTATVVPAQSSYTPGAPISISYSGLPGNVDDWITIAPAGAPYTTYRAFAFTNGNVSGTVTLHESVPGNYVVRAFAKNTYNLLLAESAAITIQP